MYKYSSTLLVPKLQSQLVVCSLLEPSTAAPKPVVKTAVRLTAAASLVSCCLKMSRQETHEARQTLYKDTTDTFTAHRPARRWNTHKSHTHTRQQSCKRRRVTRMCELQSGERARTITTTENTCSSPGYPFTSDLRHFSLL